jgi:hypothetical protein
MHIARAALLYFLLAFAAGFALGTIRTLIIAPRLGTLAAVAIEAPFILTASWFAARWVLSRHRQRHHAPMSAPSACLMGALALLMLLTADFTLAMLLAPTSPADWLDAQAQPAGLLGLACQLLFAAIPCLVLLQAPRLTAADTQGRST